MNKTKILILIGLVFQLGLKLQARDINYGILAGLGVTNARVTNRVELREDYRVFYPMYTFNINGYFENRFNSIWGIAAEPGFTRKGGVIRFGINHYMSIIKFQLNYVQVPLFVNIYCLNRFFVSIGAEFAYLINGEGNLPDIATGFADFKENAFEISGLLGMNFSITEKSDIGIRYSHGATNFSVLNWTDGFGPVIGQSKVYNQYLHFIFRYKIMKP